MQFGFIPGRSTTMAAALAHDVIDYCISNGSAVYACSLDAEAAFDGIPHSIMFQKARGALQDNVWRVLVYWYSILTLQIRWNNN